jgi:phosphoribosyl 1,2-cyclic phosphodiesterase
MRVRAWGVRGSLPTPGPETATFGGNTPCVQISGDDGSELILDAGSGIRELGVDLVGRCKRLHILLTHLHLDHIQGLLFFAPLFDPEAEITVWGPPGRIPLRKRLARYLSNPLSPVEIRDLPARVSFEEVPAGGWRIGEFAVRAALVAHRGPTLGYRLEAGAGSLCYLPDHEPGLGQDLDKASPTWISGHALASRASLLIHDCQFTDSEYPERRGWGHSRVSDALAFAHRAESARTLLFHHDPGHDDVHLDAIGEEARTLATSRGQEGAFEMAREGRLIELAI